MTDITGGVPGRPVRSRRQCLRAVIMAICGGFIVASVVTCCAVGVVIARMLNRLDSALDPHISELLAGVAAIFLAVAVLLLEVFTVLMELFALLSTGHIIPFFLKLAQLLGSI
jgi:hypothetical protein